MHHTRFSKRSWKNCPDEVSKNSNYSVGFIKTQSIYGLNITEPGKGVTVRYTERSTHISESKRSATINIFCTDDDSGYIYNVKEDGYEHTFLMNSTAGCGKLVTNN